MLTSIAKFAYRHRRLTVTVWVFTLVVAITIGSSFAGDWSDSDRLEGSDSQTAQDLLTRHRPLQSSGADSVAVFDGVRGHEPAIADFLVYAKAIPGVMHVGDLQTSHDGSVAMATIAIDDDPHANSGAAVSELTNSARALGALGVHTSFSGYLFDTSSEPSSEFIGVVAALVILIIAFGSVVAAGLPVLVALFGIGIGSALVGLLANVVSMGDVTQTVTTMIGIGVGIDYTLLIVSRYRLALHRSGDPETAVIEAMNTAGRAVLLAGAIVIVSLMGLFTIGMSTFTGLAIGAVGGVAVVICATLTFAPALLGFIGHNINRLHLGRKHPVGAVPSSTRWAGVVQSHPRVLVVLGVAALVGLAIPVTSLHLGTPDEASTPKSSTNHVAYDVISRAFGAGYHGPVLVVVDNPGDSMDVVLTAIRSTPGVVSVDEPMLSPDGAIATFTAIPSTGPTDARTEKLLQHLRNDVIPAAEHGKTHAYLGGETAGDIDFAQRCAQRLPWFIGAVLTLSFLLLFFVFHSIVIPLKAVLMNLLSLGAAGGVLIAIFQWGWGASLFGVAPGPVAPWIPELLFAIVFGLSMDYEIFLLTSIREAHDRTGDTSVAVFTGLGETARIITAAAAIMSVVFASFVTMNDLPVKMIGFGLATAIALDATVVRMLILPAVMTLLGEWNWWMPRLTRRTIGTKLAK